MMPRWDPANPPPIDLERITAGVQIVKRRFLGYRIPPVELPADSVIEDTVLELYALCWMAHDRAPRTL